MKVLFVCSGNSVNGISPIVFNQGESIKRKGIDVEYFTITGKGFAGYLKNIFLLREYLKANKYDLIHAHYFLSGLVVTLTCQEQPVLVSLMGSDIRMNFFWRIILKISCLYFWDNVIVKSKDMKEFLKLTRAHVIPNGVDISRFSSRDKRLAQKKLGFDDNKKHILFLSNPLRKEKNYKLAEDAVHFLHDHTIILHVVFDKPHDHIVDYLYASDMLLLTSLREGSPNVIKEAMVCNCPIVTTNVGDVSWILGKTEGCYIADFKPLDVSEKIIDALAFNRRTNGRQRIIDLKLDSDSIAGRVLEVYKSAVSN